jgi:uncharacterized membrane protein YkvA (DUF1232 family)
MSEMDDETTLPEPAPKAEKHPAARLGETIQRLPAYLRLARSLLGERRLSRLRKAGLRAGIVYLLSPVDLIPGVIPVLGQLDDLVAILLAIRFALRGLPGPAADALLGSAGLSRELLARDVDNIKAASGWAARGTARLGARAATMGVTAVGAAARFGARVVSRGPTRRPAWRPLSTRRR